MGFSAVLMAFAGLICLVSWIWLLIAAFRVSVLWGLILFFLAWTLIPVIIFALANWDEAKRPLALYAGGIALASGSYTAAMLTAGRELERSTESADPTPTFAHPQTADDNDVLPPPRPTALPTHASWEAVVSQMKGASEADAVTIAPTPTPVTGARRGLDWNELGSLVDRVVVVELANGTVATAALEAVEPERLRIRHNIGGGEASYWIERDEIARVRLVN